MNTPWPNHNHQALLPVETARPTPIINVPKATVQPLNYLGDAPHADAADGSAQPCQRLGERRDGTCTAHLSSDLFQRHDCVVAYRRVKPAAFGG
jgi:hypothetical protein